MDYGRLMKPFFIEIQNFWAWADKFYGIWGNFGQTISSHFGTVSSSFLVHIFYYLTIISTKKLSLHIQILNIYLELGLKFEFGPKRIRDLAIVCL